MFLEIMNFIAEYFGKAFSMMAQFQIGDFNLLGFLIVFAIIDVIVSIFIIKLDNGISFGGGHGFSYTYNEGHRINRQRQAESDARRAERESRRRRK